MNKLEHIAFIMDGNGRWANQRFLPRTMGHAEGIKAMRKVVKSCIDRGIKYITFFAFSTENWKRSEKEIKFIFDLLVDYLTKKLDDIKEKKIKVIFAGSKERLRDDVKEIIKKTQKGTENLGEAATVIVALNYGGRDDIVTACNKLIENGAKNITEKDLSNNLYTKGIPDPDLLVRSSGEMRISNFLLWQTAYSEFIFEKTYWPDFNDKVISKIIKEYNSRNRRFGDAK